MRSYIDLSAPFKASKGIIGFEDVNSDFLDCTCGNTVMDSGFDSITSDCGRTHYECNRCKAYACIDEGLRIVRKIAELRVCGMEKS